MVHVWLLWSRPVRTPRVVVGRCRPCPPPGPFSHRGSGKQEKSIIYRECWQALRCRHVVDRSRDPFRLGRGPPSCPPSAAASSSPASASTPTIWPSDGPSAPPRCARPSSDWPATAWSRCSPSGAPASAGSPPRRPPTSTSSACCSSRSSLRQSLERSDDEHRDVLRVVFAAFRSATTIQDGIEAHSRFHADGAPEVCPSPWMLRFTTQLADVSRLFQVTSIERRAAAPPPGEGAQGHLRRGRSPATSTPASSSTSSTCGARRCSSAARPAPGSDLRPRSRRRRPRGARR